MQHKSQTKLTTANNSNQDLKIKRRKVGAFKFPPPSRRDRMLCAILYCKNLQDNNKNDQFVLSFDEPNLCNGYISKEQDRNNQFYINFPRYYVLGHALLDVDPLNDVDFWKEVV